MLDKDSSLEDIVAVIINYHIDRNKPSRIKKVFFMALISLAIGVSLSIDYPDYSTSLIANVFYSYVIVLFLNFFINIEIPQKDIVFNCRIQENLMKNLEKCNKEKLNWTYREFKFKRDDWESSIFFNKICIVLFSVLIVFVLWNMQQTSGMFDFFILSPSLAFTTISILLIYLFVLERFLGTANFMMSSGIVLSILKEILDNEQANGYLETHQSDKVLSN